MDTIPKFLIGSSEGKSANNPLFLKLLTFTFETGTKDSSSQVQKNTYTIYFCEVCFFEGSRETYKLVLVQLNTPDHYCFIVFSIGPIVNS